MKTTNQSESRRWHNRPEEHKTTKLEYRPCRGTIKMMFRLNGSTFERRYETWKDGRLSATEPKDEYVEVVQWNKLSDGRLYISINGERWYAHQLSWFFRYGVRPSRVKFKDGDKSNYAVTNLLVQSIGIRRPYQARVRVGDTIRCLGSYATKQDAIDAQDAFKALLKLGIV